MNDLASKSKGLKKVMQPRLAYKYGQRETSTTDLINMQAQSQYAFSNRKASNGRLGQTQTMNGFNRRSKSIIGGNPAAAPSSGHDNFMFNDTSAKQIDVDDMIAAGMTIKSNDDGNLIKEKITKADGGAPATTVAPTKEERLANIHVAGATLASFKQDISELKSFMAPPKAAETICIYLEAFVCDKKVSAV